MRSREVIIISLKNNYIIGILQTQTNLYLVSDKYYFDVARLIISPDFIGSFSIYLPLINDLGQQTLIKEIKNNWFGLTTVVIHIQVSWFVSTVMKIFGCFISAQ